MKYSNFLLPTTATTVAVAAIKGERYEVCYVGIHAFIRFVEVNLPDKFSACDGGGGVVGLV